MRIKYVSPPYLTMLENPKKIRKNNGPCCPIMRSELQSVRYPTGTNRRKKWTFLFSAYIYVGVEVLIARFDTVNKVFVHEYIFSRKSRIVPWSRSYCRPAINLAHPSLCH